MTLRDIKVFVLLFSLFLFTRDDSIGQSDIKESHILVSLRMIGHQVLLSTGDSTSRVLPIEKEGERYKIQFSSEFKFDPDEIVKVVDHVVNNSGIAENYIVEIEKCQTSDIVYSFQISESEQSNLVPCRGRVQPSGCYVLYFTIKNVKSQNLANANLNKTMSYGMGKIEFTEIIFISVLAIMFIGATINFTSGPKRKTEESEKISIGGYQFDAQNTKLYFNEEAIELTSKESDLLFLLYTSVNTTVERDHILKEVWGDEGDYIGRTLDVFISRLRKKLEGDASVKIVNVRGVGYRLILNKENK
ncbi:response regulator transcription factor [Mangrovivirga sp. M17]|uniref:Response regulator transcription factor n=1 Tax=Mangrovivirga halotolerans TaxID=2993936 RepID=A0ABT3RUL9_9BACT|nr:response regulator transcription factor [Mangrovivirga halotolerans]MCX2745478.1 response regulator transcription factor [Mangrovivirga halotolerans]